MSVSVFCNMIDSCQADQSKLAWVLVWIKIWKMYKHVGWNGNI